MSEGSGAGTGAKVGAGILGVLGLLIARGGDDCAMAGMRAGSHVPPGSAAGLSDDLARAGGGLGDDLAYGGGRYGGGLGDDLGGLGDDLGGVGSANRLGALGASADDGAGAAAGDLFEAGLDVTFEVVTLDLGEDESYEADWEAVTEPADVDPRLREVWLQITARDPTLIVATPASGYDLRAIRDTVARAGESTPIGLVGITEDGGETIRLGGVAVTTKDLHRECLDARHACVVFACPDDACVAAAQSTFEAAAQDSRQRVVLRYAFEHRLVAARGAVPELRAAVVSRLELPRLGQGGFRGGPVIVESRVR